MIHYSLSEDKAIELKPISEGFIQVAKPQDRGKQEEVQINTSGENDIKNKIMRALDEILEREENSGLIVGRYVKNGIGGGDVVVGVVAGLMVAGAFVI